MSSTKLRRKAPASTLRAYKVYQQALVRGNIQRAFEIFEAQPDLANHLTLLQIPVQCRLMSDALGGEATARFIKSLQHHIQTTQRILQLLVRYNQQYAKRRRQRLNITRRRHPTRFEPL